ncbi:DUF1254 domain-containing protein [Notoacmeibacter sp. MSK16QG-6]|uniref:DUF1254 domain-containing protein n=1 Tax=Notoacmeibacter sp. MSK16QG-6 TaxID=2957982 RepID=UPI00209F85F2|nr:DUF1254 domain-containing protein [Notoacmeibacter sp. MSK16QG-6]MCP1198144.1 DUF1254 domain-containing protein [Notoacmeibacter sp. MSK16QG-6]
MRRLSLALMIGLVGAGLVHIAVVFLLPTAAPASAWSRIYDITEPFQLRRLDDTDIIYDADPLFTVAACRFDLTRGPLRIRASGNVPFWSVAIMDSRGRTSWSINDRNGTDDDLDLMVVTRLQEIEIKREMPPGLASTAFALFNNDEGIAVLRIFHPDDSYEPVSDSFLDSVSCEPF